MILTFKSTLKSSGISNSILAVNSFGNVEIRDGAIFVPWSKTTTYKFRFSTQYWIKKVVNVIRPSVAPELDMDDLVVYDNKLFDYLKCSEEQITKYYQELRRRVCFPVVNRGKLWYDRLEPHQITELNEWYEAWLDVTDSKVIPTAPIWLNDKLKKLETEELL